jgi:putative holliday junction resolvase
MRFIGIDYGVKRVGVAISDEDGAIAFPHSLLMNDKDLLANLQSVIEENSVGTVVVGESKDFEGNDNLVMEQIILFVKKLEDTLSVSVVYEPEVFTSAAARRQFENKEHRSRKSNVVPYVDASAAALILQSYLDKQKSNHD